MSQHFPGVCIAKLEKLELQVCLWPSKVLVLGNAKGEAIRGADCLGLQVKSNGNNSGKVWILDTNKDSRAVLPDSTAIFPLACLLLLPAAQL